MKLLRNVDRWEVSQRFLSLIPCFFLFFTSNNCFLEILLLFLIAVNITMVSTYGQGRNALRVIFDAAGSGDPAGSDRRR